MLEKLLLKFRMLEEEQKLLVFTLPITTGLIIYFFITYKFSFATLGYTILVLLVVLFIPYLIIIYWKSRRILAMEAYFPALLRNLAESKKAGMSLIHAIANASQAYYGPLTKEVKRLNALLSWGVPFPEAIDHFRKRVKYSNKMYRGLSIILETYYAGGDLASAMENVAESIETIKKLEKDRESLLQQQALIIYVVHGVFIGVIIMLYRVLIPLLAVQKSLAAAGEFVTVLGTAPTTEFYRILFLLALSIQSVSSGIVIGETKEGSAIAGLKYVIILFGLSMAAYAVFILPRNIELEVAVSSQIIKPKDFIEIAGSVVYEGKPVKGAAITVVLGENFLKLESKEDGSFTGKIMAPEVEGTYQLVIKASYQGAVSKKVINIEVSS